MAKFLFIAALSLFVRPLPGIHIAGRLNPRRYSWFELSSAGELGRTYYRIEFKRERGRLVQSVHVSGLNVFPFIHAL